MSKRIFIAINPPKKIKDELIKQEDELHNLFPEEIREGMFKWAPKENLHLTLAFLGKIKEEILPKIEEAIERTAKDYSPFTLNFGEISYGPTQKLPPRLIWLTGQKRPEMASLVKDLQKKLHGIGALKKIDEREFIPHITLARVRKTAWRRMEPEDRPDIERNLDLSFKVGSIDIMESKLKRSGAEYSVLKSFKL